MLWCLVRDIRSLDTILPIADFAYNSSVNRSIGMSPFEVVWGYKPRVRVDLIHITSLHRSSAPADSFAHNIHPLHDEIKKRINTHNDSYCCWCTLSPCWIQHVIMRWWSELGKDNFHKEPLKSYRPWLNLVLFNLARPCIWCKLRSYKYWIKGLSSLINEYIGPRQVRPGLSQLPAYFSSVSSSSSSSKPYLSILARLIVLFLNSKR